MICLQNKKECAYIKSSGECEILTNTKFIRPCPFFRKGKNESERDYIVSGYPGCFRTIRGWEGRYLVSEYGVVVNRRGKELPIGHDLRGYPTVQLLTHKGTKTTIRIAVLVAEAFLGEMDGVICFRDGNVENCERYNLYRRQQQ